MLWKLSADAALTIHLLWILFIVFGALIGRQVIWVRWLHVGALVFSLCLQSFDWVCPLTSLEVWLRRHHEQHLTYTGDFVAHYVQELVYVPAPKATIFMATCLIVGATAWAYWPKSHER